MMRKSISRIAFLALAALSAPDSLRADQVEVTFDTALTNTTAWAYSEKILISSEGEEHPYFRTLESAITSPEYSFNITSITVRLSCTSTDPTRNLRIKPSFGEELQTSNVAKKDATEYQSFLFARENAVRSFSITLKGSGQTGYWHIYSAVISGVPIVDPPADVAVDSVEGTRCRLTWTNSGNISSNRIDVSKIVQHESAGTTLDEYDFMAFTNKNANASPCFDKGSLQMDFYPAFSGTNIYAAGSSTGIVQISSPDMQGHLRYDFTGIRGELDEGSGVSLLVSAKKHATDVSTVQWKLLVAQVDDGGETNRTDEIELGAEFPASPFEIPIVQPWACQAIVMRPSDGTKRNRRILIDSIAFADGHARATVSTNFVKSVFATDSATCSVRGLAPWTDYVARVTAFDADGNESAPSPPVDFATNGGNLPFVIMLK